MAHWAKINRDNIVESVVVTDNISEDDGEYFVHNVLGGNWVKTSVNTFGGIHYTQELDELGNKIPSSDQSKALRFNYAGIGFTYDADADAFVPPKPYDSWVLDESTYSWAAPVDEPEGNLHEWDESTISWVAIEPEMTDPEALP